MNFELINNANVNVTKVFNPQGNVQARLKIDDRFEHTFPSTSRISKHLSLMEPQQLAQRLSGGHYFMVDDQLVDFRTSEYKGFIHDERSIGALVDNIGFLQAGDKSLPRHLRKPRASNDDSVVSKIRLAGVWDDFDFDVPSYAEGGDFSSQLRFEWSPFQQFVTSAFDIIRQICTNGMVGLTPLINTKVPLINRWEQHLDIAAEQLKHKIGKLVTHRLEHLGSVRASVSDVLLARDHVAKRLDTSVQADRPMLANLAVALDPGTHMGHIYKDTAFDDKAVAAQLPSHLTGMDLYNIVTELRSHTNETGKSSDRALDIFSNKLVFDYEGLAASAAGFKNTNVSAFADHRAAFFGNMS